MAYSVTEHSYASQEEHVRKGLLFPTPPRFPDSTRGVGSDLPFGDWWMGMSMCTGVRGRGKLRLCGAVMLVAVSQSVSCWSPGGL